MNKNTLYQAITLALGTTSFSTQAALTTSAVLEFDTGVVECIVNVGTPPNNCYYGTMVTSGSYFAFDGNGDGNFTQPERQSLAMHDGIHIGTTQIATGSHEGEPFGAANNYTDGTITESPSITEPWALLGNTGMFYSASPVVDLGVDGNGDHLLDFSGWRMTWNGIIGDLGAGGTAVISCSNTSCSHSSTFTLDYFTTIPQGDPSGMGSIQYAFHLEGHVSNVPVPAAAWLFSTGLIGLVSIAKRRKVKL